MISMILPFLVLSLDYFLFWIWVVFLCFFVCLVYFNWNFEFCFIYYRILLYSFEDFFPGICLRYLWISVVLLRLDFKLCWVESRTACTWGTNLVLTLKYNPSEDPNIMGSLCFGWWEHELLPALCDLQELPWLLCPQPWGVFSHLCAGEYSAKDSRGLLCWSSEIFLYEAPSFSLLCLTDSRHLGILKLWSNSL